MICPKCSKRIKNQDYYYNYDHSLECGWAFHVVADEIKTWQVQIRDCYLFSNKNDKYTIYDDFKNNKHLKLNKYFEPGNINKIIQTLEKVKNFQ